jgi:hypothetical protein
VYLLNLVLLVALGVALSGWTLWYTDAFPAVGGLLGLGGLFAWIAFVSGILREERKQELQRAFEERVLLGRRTGLAVVAVAAAFLAGWAGWHGTVEVGGLADAGSRVVRVERVAAAASAPAGAPAAEGLLTARGRVRFLLPTLPWRPAVYRVRPAGLPARTVTVRPLARVRLASPDAFLLQPALLVRPPAAVANFARRHPFSLAVRRLRAGAPDAFASIPAYRGEAAWIGCGADVEVPERILDRWRLDLVAEGSGTDPLAWWRAPLGVELDLAAGDSVIAGICSGGTVMAASRIEVEEVRRASEFPQVNTLERGETASAELRDLACAAPPAAGGPR